MNWTLQILVIFIVSCPLYSFAFFGLTCDIDILTFVYYIGFKPLIFKFEIPVKQQFHLNAPSFAEIYFCFMITYSNNYFTAYS